MACTLVFDLGGVVLRWQPAELLRQTLPHRLAAGAAAGQLAAAFFESFRCGGDWAEFDRGVLGTDDVARRIARRLGFADAEVLAVLRAIPEHLQLRADSVELLAELAAAGQRLVFLSNMPAPFVDHAQRQLDSLGYFADGVFSSQVGLVKPDPAIFGVALQRFASRAADCLLLDDNAGNVEAALGQGWQARCFSDAAAARRDLVELGLLPAR